MAPTFIKRYLTALDRHKWAGLAGFTVVMGLSSVAALQPAPPATFTSSGILAYVTPPLTFSQTGLALQQQAQAVTREILLSDYVLNKAIKSLAADQIQINAGALRHNTNVKINPDKNTSGLHVVVIYVDSDSARAQTSLTRLMEAMVEQSRFLNNQQLDVVVGSLNELLPKVTKELEDAEQNVERYIRVEGPQLQAAREGDVLGALAGSESQQRQIRFSLEGVNAQIQSLQTRLGLSPAQAYTSSALSADPIIGDLRGRIYQIDSQVVVLAQTLRPEHPTMVDLQNQRRAYEKLLQQRMIEVVGNSQPIGGSETSIPIQHSITLDPARQQLANTLVSLETQRDTLQQQLLTLRRSEQQLRQEYQRIPNKQLELARLQQQVQLKRSFYDQIESRLADTKIARNETQGNLVIAQPAETEITQQTTSNPVLILLVGGFVGLLVGGGLILLLDSLDATFRTLPDLQSALRQQEVAVLGLLPVILPQQEDELMPLVIDPESPYTEPYERFRSNLRRAGGGKVLKLILLTSTVNDEGKTLTAYNLAIASARAGKRTLLIEADLRSPSQSKALKVTPDPSAMMEPLRYYGRVNDCIRLVPEVENLYILPSPGIQRQAAAILESSEMRQLLEDARGRFDLVLLDSPALSRYSDALLLEPHTDGMLLVTRPGHTEEGLLTEAIEQFNESEEIQFLGAVINGGDIPIQSPSILSKKEEPLMIEDLDTQPDLDGIRIY